VQSLDLLSGLAVKVAAIGAVMATTAGFIDFRYAHSADLKAHMVAADKSKIADKIEHYEDKISITEDALAVLEAQRADRPLTPKEALVETQLQNRKARYLRKLEAVNPR